ncbi:aromatic aminotransferase ISS1 isoform X3 [Malania oleifera]|uniref:aromatic aminotransferase ISS1 isoform X3 n=1 Tax=Malania oleifera TaxID=397392 RepID=UPI0025AE2911|nr:aromatic aminotransferase ISS1 isoform X3 [Malania oleifera]
MLTALPLLIPFTFQRQSKSRTQKETLQRRFCMLSRPNCVSSWNSRGSRRFWSVTCLLQERREMGSNRMLARRALETDTPVMVQIQQLLRGVKDAMSLAQLHQENKLYKSSVMVTAGANQAFVNLVLTLCDAEDSVIMFAPYYFNAYMSFQMTGITNILVGPGHPKTLHPDADWLEKTLLETKPTPKLVTVVNPGNPSGTYIPVPLLKRISDLCKDAGSWLVVDNTYEYFMYDGLKHSCMEGDHIVNVFSFSKAYGMMGWRVGYIAYPTDVEGLGAQLLKVQDNIPICASIISQRLALYSLETGPEWVTEQVKDLVKNRTLLLEALSPLGNDAVKGGEGAIYLWAKLPEKYRDDFEVVYWLARRHGVVVIPGSASGGPGYIRISFGGLKEDDCRAAAERLRRGLGELVRDGMVQ